MDARELLRTRRSIRKYDQKDIPRDVLNEVIDLARYAPSGGNAQEWEIIAVDDSKRIREVYDTLAWLPATGEPPEGQRPTAYLVIISNEEAGLADCASLATYLTLAAHAVGLGSCWFGSIRRTELADDLDVPDDYDIEFVISLGYPAEDAGTIDASGETQVIADDDRIQVPKRTVESLVHYNVFGDPQ